MKVNESVTKGPVPGATFALLVLTLMNLLNYVDRWVPSAVKELLKGDLKLTDAQTSWPLSAFVLVYMVASPIFGALAETRSRKVLIGLGVAAWSLATAAAAFAQGFASLLIARALVGVGEAAYASLAPTLLADFFPPEKRNRIFTYFYVATPVGSALGFVLGGLLGEHFGWRTAFLAVGLPGLLLAGLALFIQEPPRGQFDESPLTKVSWPEALRALSKNRVYLYTVAGYTLVTFATGGIADWFPTFLSRLRELPLSQADYAVGTTAVVGGLIGTSLGGFIADRLGPYTRNPYLAVSGLAMLPAVLFTVFALFVMRAPTAIVLAIGMAQISLWIYNAPVNALIVNNVEPGMRARAVGLSILCIHLFGDVLSPPLIGAVSDATHNLELALVMVPVAILLGGLVWILGWRNLPVLSTDPS
jgi:MFS transporter, Spinster family, sphingosine-1-phosphate transporter